MTGWRLILKTRERHKLMDIENLLIKAEESRQKAYAPYSKFTVGAALLTSDGEVYCGCNVENASFSPTCCAERVAFFNAVSNGKREFCAIAVVGRKYNESTSKSPCFPCGVCRQVMSEFCDGSFLIVTSDGEGNAIEMTLDDLLPKRFEL